MKRIEEFINSVYARVDDGQEAMELKTEMRTHLLDAVEELKAEGKSEQDAISIALERFGDERMLSGRITEYFMVPRIFSVNLLRIAIIFAIAGLLIASLFAFNEFRQNNELERVMQGILSELNTDQEISEADKIKIVEFAQSSPDIKRIKISPDYNSTIDNEGFTYNHPKPFKHIMYWNSTAGTTATNGTWRVDTSYEQFDLAWINMIVVCLVVYWVLFAIWAMIQAYRHRRLHALWMVAFSLFNVPHILPIVRL